MEGADGGKKSIIQMEKCIRKLYMTGQLLLEYEKKKTSVWSHQTQMPKIVISLVFRLMGGQPFSPCD